MINIKEILADDTDVKRGARGLNLPPDVLKARKSEQSARSVRATNMAQKALMRLHKSDYDDLRQQAIDVVNEERGPLPGDDMLARDEVVTSAATLHPTGEQ